MEPILIFGSCKPLKYMSYYQGSEQHYHSVYSRIQVKGNDLDVAYTDFEVQDKSG